MKNRAWIGWLLASTAATVAFGACTTGSGTGDDEGFGGFGNRTGAGGGAGTTGATTTGSGGATGGTTGNGGTSGSGGTSSTTTSTGAGGMPAGGAAGSGNGSPALVCGDAMAMPTPGDCEQDTLDDPCGACIRSRCCDEFEACVAQTPGDGPDEECGWGGPADGGPSGESYPGEFFCIQDCMLGLAEAGMFPTRDDLEGCTTPCQTAECSLGVSDVTSALIGCMVAEDEDPNDCFDECFDLPLE